MEWYIDKEWKLERKGLRKQVLDIKFVKLSKPRQVSKVVIKVEDVQELNERPSKYLSPPLNQEPDQGQTQQLEMGSALTPVDCYVELLLQQMIVGERARCFIKCQSQPEEVSFVVTLEAILESQMIHKLKVDEMYALALRYKENGVAMFKQYPLFAHDYFARAAKCLISYKPFNDLTLERDGVAAPEMEALFRQIQTNLAACLLAQKRYDDVIYQTQFVEDSAETPTEKSIYRRAMAYFHMQEFEAAQKTIERLPNATERKEFAKLQKLIAERWKLSNDHYKTLVQRMFNK